MILKEPVGGVLVHVLSCYSVVQLHELSLAHRMFWGFFLCKRHIGQEYLHTECNDHTVEKVL